LDSLCPTPCVILEDMIYKPERFEATQTDLFSTHHCPSSDTKCAVRGRRPRLGWWSLRPLRRPPPCRLQRFGPSDLNSWDEPWWQTTLGCFTAAVLLGLALLLS